MRRILVGAIAMVIATNAQAQQSAPRPGLVATPQNTTAPANTPQPGQSTVYPLYPPNAMPTFSPAPGTFKEPQSVTISAPQWSRIYYTTDGSQPSGKSQRYTGPIQVNEGTTTIKAFAAKDDPVVPDSEVASATYVVMGKTAAPTFSPAEGKYPTPQTVTISGPAGATIYCTTDGSTPTTSSPTCTGPIQVGVGTTKIQAIAQAPNSVESPVASATYEVAPAEPTTVVIEAGKVQLREKIQFDTGKATIKPVSDKILSDTAQVLKLHPEVKKVEIQGHTDSTGSKALNTKLSQARADAVKAALVAKGLEADRFTTKGYGPTKPIESNKTARGREANRRVEFVIRDGPGAIAEEPAAPPAKKAPVKKGGKAAPAKPAPAKPAPAKKP
jgi:outer membrane protein OmpA-like peptidoglycan-associated protein